MRLATAIATTLATLAIHPAAAVAATPLVPVDPHFQDEVVLEHLDSPVAVRFAPPPDGRIFVAEKSGLVEAFDGPGDTTPALVADLRDEVQDFWDRGLLGMALDPGFATNGRMYLLYTRDKPIGGDGPPQWGGSLRAQDIRTPDDPLGLDGAIVRLDPSTGARRIVAYGLRNPFRFAFRPGTGDLWIGDVGEQAWEEIDRLEPAGGVDDPVNFGWPCFEGRARNPRWTALRLPLCTSLADADVTPPVFAYAHQQP